MFAIDCAKIYCNFGSIIEKYWQLFIETLHYPYFYIIASAGGISPSQQKSLLEIYKKSQVDLKLKFCTPSKSLPVQRTFICMI